MSKRRGHALRKRYAGWGAIKASPIGRLQRLDHQMETAIGAARKRGTNPVKSKRVKRIARAEIAVLKKVISG